MRHGIYNRICYFDDHFHLNSLLFIYLTRWVVISEINVGHPSCWNNTFIHKHTRNAHIHYLHPTHHNHSLLFLPSLRLPNLLLILLSLSPFLPFSPSSLSLSLSCPPFLPFSPSSLSLSCSPSFPSCPFLSHHNYRFSSFVRVNDQLSDTIPLY